MSELKSNGYFVDKTGARVEIVDKEARDGVAALTAEIAELKNGGETAETVTKTGAVVSLEASKGAKIEVKADTDETVTLNHSGKNMIPAYSGDDTTRNGCTIAKNANGKVTISGTPTATTYFDVATNASPIYLPAGNYTLLPVGFPTASGLLTFSLTATDGTLTKSVTADGKVNNFVIENGGLFRCYYQANKAFTGEATTCGVMLVNETVLACDYEPPTVERIDTILPSTIIAYKGVNIFYTDSGDVLTVSMCEEKDEAYSFDATVWGLPVLTLDGDCTGMTKDDYVSLSFTFQDKDGNQISGNADVKKQGSSSIGMGEQIGGAFDTDVGGLFNFTIKFPEAFEAKAGWTAQKKYCFKANAIDHSHARNVCSCKLWGEIVKSRANVPSELSGLVNGGAIDGFPIIIVLNGKYYALGTFNIPKDGWMFGSPKAILCADAHSESNKFKELATLDGDFELEYVEDEDNADWVLPSLNTAIQSVIDSDGTDLDTVVGQYIDIPSAIDYYIHTVDERADDGMDKNYLLVTFDGVKWFFSAYDRDTVYGLNWDGKYFNSPASGITFAGFANNHRLMYLIRHHKTADLKARAIQLRNGVKSEANVMQVFTNFTAGIPAEVLAQNCRRWPLLRSTSASNLAQIVNWYRLRRQVIDKEIDAMA